MIRRPDGKECWPFFIRWESGRFEFALQYTKTTPFYGSLENRQALVETMTRKLGAANLRLSAKASDGWPSIAVADLLRPEIWTGFTEVASEIIERIQERAI